MKAHEFLQGIYFRSAVMKTFRQMDKIQYNCMVKKKKKEKEQNITFSVNMLFIDIIKALMSLLLSALLLTHLFNLAHNCPYVALKSLKNSLFLVTICFYEAS